MSNDTAAAPVAELKKYNPVITEEPESKVEVSRGVHDVLRAITYRGPGPHKGQLILPGAARLTFDHITEPEYLLLVKRGVIRKAAKGAKS